MNLINRQRFLKQSLTLGALTILTPGLNQLLANTGAGTNEHWQVDGTLMQRMIEANDKQVQLLLAAPTQRAFSRRVGFDYATMAASYVSSGSKYFQDNTVLVAIENIVDQLLNVQSEDGTVSMGNLESPPDTAFLLEPICAGTKILRELQLPGLASSLEKIKTFITNAAVALTTGGVHTPNHRWVISAALAQVNELYPNKKYVARIEDWLGEGVFNDADGHYPERSMTYSFVENKALMTIERLLGKTSLFVPVRKNLTMTYFYMEPNGDLVTTDSRRQDQYMNLNILSWYLLYRYAAIRDNNAQFAAVAKTIEGFEGFETTILHQALFQFLENPLLQKPLPAPAVLPLVYNKFFRTSNLARIRKQDTTTTIFGGVDWPIVIASGRSNSPNFFSYRKGKAVLKYLRLSSEFFSMGYFYSDGLKQQGDGYTLHKKLAVPYYQPLPKNLRNAQGDYTLSPSIDGRFWNKMAFDKRPVSNVKQLQTTVRISEANGRTALHFTVLGMKGIAVTIELCFKEGGQLSGTTGIADTQHNFLENGEGAYEYKGDTIHFGPGTIAGKNVDRLEGERYSTHFGSLKTAGMHVFLTGTTPFEHTLYFY